MRTVVKYGESVTAVLSGAAAATNPTYTIDSVDECSGAGTTSAGSLTDTTAVVLLTSTLNPQVVKGISVYNGDTSAVVVTLKKVSSAAVAKTIVAITLQVGDTLVVSETEFHVLDTSGQVKGSGGVIAGQLTLPAGGSTAAAGTTTADATALPAATSSVYPTTAADDAKGVRVHTSDKVTGRTLYIGNGVSNKILKVYAPSGGTINGAAADAAFSSASGKGVVIHCLSSAGNTWLAW